jgi:hypothetical protein
MRKLAQRVLAGGAFLLRPQCAIDRFEFGAVRFRTALQYRILSTSNAQRK